MSYETKFLWILEEKRLLIFPNLKKNRDIFYIFDQNTKKKLTIFTVYNKEKKSKITFILQS